MREPRAAATPDDVLHLISPLLARCGVTRLGDITGMDATGVPAATATRPLALTAPVTAAAAPSREEATAEAALAALALWHAEACVPPPSACLVPSAALGAPSELAALGLPPGSLATASTPLDWVEAAPPGGGPAVLVPRDLVALTPAAGRWQPGRLAATAAGLSAFPRRAAAVTRALCDIAAREAAAELPRTPPGCRAHVDLGTVPDPRAAAMIDGIRLAGGQVTAAAVPSWPGMACVAAWLRFEDTRPLAAAGIAASPDPAQALRGAITDAARCRAALVTGIAGSTAGLRYRAGQADPDDPASVLLPWDELPALPGWPAVRPADPGQAVLSSCLASGGRPLAVDLPADGGLSVVKVLLARGVRHPAGQPGPAAEAA